MKSAERLRAILQTSRAKVLSVSTSYSSRRWAGFAIGLLCGLAVRPVSAQVPSSTQDEFLYADVVIRCTVRRIEAAWVPHHDLFPQFQSTEPLPQPVTFLHVRVDETLRGYVSADTVQVLLYGGNHSFSPDPLNPGKRYKVFFTGYTYNHQMGDDMVLPLQYLPSVRNGVFVALPDYGQFLYVNGVLRNRSDPELGIPIQQVRNLLSNSHPDRVFDRARLVLRGTVTDVRREQVEGPARRNEIAYVTMRPTSVYKGTLSEDVLTLRMITRGTDDPVKSVVPNVATGEEWIVFLEADRKGYFPFAGSNGMFRVVDGRLLRNNRVALKGAERQQLQAIIGEGSR